MNKSVYILKDRSILYVNGPDAKTFLQNLISNDINKVNDSSSCFASLLTPQGKFLYEFIIVKNLSQSQYLNNWIFINLDQKLIY